MCLSLTKLDWYLVSLQMLPFFSLLSCMIGLSSACDQYLVRTIYDMSDDSRCASMPCMKLTLSFMTTRYLSTPFWLAIGLI